MTPLVLDVLHCRLTGVNLIEASAGTGKTWTTVSLYIRLLLEEEWPSPPLTIDQILVVTYTRAATAELRERVRYRLNAFLQVLQGESSDDPFLTALAGRFADSVARRRAVARLLAALQNFDMAAIYTIHSFCQRVLTEMAFESAQSFSVQAIADDSGRLLELVDDFWRQHVVANPSVARALAHAGQTPEAWLLQTRLYLSRPYLKVVEFTPSDVDAIYAQLVIAWEKISADPAMLQQGLACFLQAPGFNARRYSDTSRHKSAALLTNLLQAAGPPWLSPEEQLSLAKMTPAALAVAMRKGFSPPQHPLFLSIADWLRQWEAYIAALEMQIAALKCQLIEWVNEKSSQHHLAEHPHSFDDLLTQLAAALQKPQSGAVLATRIARTFRAALIDEFQDTDPIQYSIFRTAFIEQGCPVFLVGDPKQAIYSFRGADIFAYLAARSDVSTHYVLDTNWRSDKPLVDAINALFSRASPFVLPEINYQSFKAAPLSRQRLEIEDGRAPFCIAWMDFAATTAGASQEQAGKLAAEASANEVVRLLNLASQGLACVVEQQMRRPLTGGDIAILVATHRQADLVRDVLRQRNVHSVALTQQSVFHSAEARDLLILLRAWVEPANVALLRSLLVTELVGMDAATLLHQMESDGWEVRLRYHMDDHQRWAEHGFMAAWRNFFLREHVAERLLPLPDGERRLTNLSHLTELLQTESGRRTGLAALLSWFEHRMRAGAVDEDAMLRLESDASLVKIVTIHTSKGLEYPIVFCPFLWSGSLGGTKSAFWRVHENQLAYLVPDVLADDALRLAACKEALSEKLRLLYVALTRAQHRQYIVWGWVQKMQTAALSWLWYGQDVDILHQLTTQDMTAALVKTEVERFIAAAPKQRCYFAAESVVESVSPTHDATATYRACDMRRALKMPWWIASYTSLTSHLYTPHTIDRVDNDKSVIEVYDRFHFPRGARPGSCLHAILEAIDFTDWPTIAPTVDRELQRFGIAPQWQAAARDMVERALDVPLDPGVTLRNVTRQQRLVELDFLLPVGQLNITMLCQLLSDANNGLHAAMRTAALALQLPAVTGFLKGFIDLVFEAHGRFYMVDYKSTYLGDQTEDYGPDALAASVATEHYYLQYLIYCVALKRYLAARGLALADRFGGVRYIYLRGLDSLGNGVWRDQPSSWLIDRLDRLFEEGTR